MSPPALDGQRGILCSAHRSLECRAPRNGAGEAIRPLPTWILLSLAFPVLLGVVNILDKLIVDRFAPAVYFYAFWIGVYEIVIGLAIVSVTSAPFQTKPEAAPVLLIVRRVKPTPGSQLALFARYSYHAFITDRDGETLELEADHRRHAEVENAIRDLKYGVGLNHMPSGRFAANGAWLAVQVMAHNLARWTARIGLGERTVITKTLRRRAFALVGRITRSARRLTLHLPRRWPWKTQFSRALARLQAIPFPA